MDSENWDLENSEAKDDEENCRLKNLEVTKEEDNWSLDHLEAPTKEKDNWSLDEIYEKWDPLGSNYHSYLNININSEQSKEYGESYHSTNYTKRCPLPIVNVASKKCFKGDRCPYKIHDYFNTEDILSNPKLIELKEEKEVLIEQSLIKNEPASDDTFNIVYVSFITNPWDFYIIPYSNWSECMCQKLIYSEQTDQESIRAVDTYWRMIKEMRKEFANAKSSPSYLKGELVCVKHSLDPKSKMDFYRAVVLETSIIEELKIPTVKARLLDKGTEIETSLSNVYPLTKKYKYPNLALHCSLYGISPIRYTWDPDTISLFKNLILERDCILRVRNSISEYENSTFLSKSKPYQVDLYMKMNEGYFSVSDYLIKNKKGIKWNLYSINNNNQFCEKVPFEIADLFYKDSEKVDNCEL